eukprot:5836820-Alexandrium_andersonii.AAC.1
MDPLARDLRSFLCKDLEAIRQKHLVASGERWLHIASYLDPRFRKHPAFDATSLDRTRGQVQELACKYGHEHATELGALQAAVAAHPDNRPLASLSAPPMKRRRRTSAAAGSSGPPPPNAADPGTPLAAAAAERVPGRRRLRPVNSND